jgi:hypothetical protein
MVLEVSRSGGLQASIPRAEFKLQPKSTTDSTTQIKPRLTLAGITAKKGRNEARSKTPYRTISIKSTQALVVAAKKEKTHPETNQYIPAVCPKNNRSPAAQNESVAMWHKKAREANHHKGFLLPRSCPKWKTEVIIQSPKPTAKISIPKTRNDCPGAKPKVPIKTTPINNESASAARPATP